MKYGRFVTALIAVPYVVFFPIIFIYVAARELGPQALSEYAQVWRYVIGREKRAVD